jgi:riboflavin biosynthesis pyrimidine reductase
VAGKALRERLVDRVVRSLVPAVIGAGRPCFGHGELGAAIQFDNPQIVTSKRVTHLVHDVRP